MKFYFGLCLLGMAWQPVAAQTHLRFGPELGMTISRLPWSRTWEDQIGGSSHETMQLFLGPLIGGQAQLDLGPHWQLAGGLRYQKIGESYTEMLESPPWAITQKHRHTFHRLSIPLTIGYGFRVKKIPFAVAAGVQSSWFMSGVYYRYYILSQPATSFEPTSEHESWNLLKGEAWWYPTGRLQSQFHVHWAIFPSDRFKISISYSTAGQIIYSKNVPSPFDGCDCIFLFPPPRVVEFRRHELGLSLVYFLKGTAARHAESRG